MTSGPIVVQPDERPKPLDVGEALTVLASGAQTGGYEIFLQVGHEGSGPPPHHHPWDEAFYVIRGEVAFGADRYAEATVGPGTLVHIPGGTVHWFRVGEGGAEMLSVTSPTGASGFFTAISRDSLGDSTDFADLVLVAASHGATILPPT